MPRDRPWPDTCSGSRDTSSGSGWDPIPTGQIGNDRPLEITDEQWESAELKLLVLSRHHDPRTGDVEYRLTNVSRAEPASHLFTVARAAGERR